VVEPAAAPILRHNPHLDALFVLPRRRGLGRLRDDLTLARHLRGARFDVAVDLHGGPRSAWLAWASRAPTRIGYTIPGRTWMYTHPVPRQPEPSSRHSVLNQWDLLGPLGVTGPPDPDGMPVEMIDDPGDAARAAAQLAAARLTPAQELVLIHVSASNPFKRWPAESFVELIVRLVQGRPAAVAMVVSGPSEPSAAHDVAQAARLRLGDDAARVLAPQLTLGELRVLAAGSAVYIGGDSGPLHVVATTQTPIVELLGPTLASRSFPWRPRRLFTETLDAGPLPCRPCNERHCVPGDFRCLTSIDALQVIAAAEGLLRAPASLGPVSPDRR
jgi:ADP-heptose:LPS heptosyltransferase